MSALTLLTHGRDRAQFVAAEIAPAAGAPTPRRRRTDQPAPWTAEDETEFQQVEAVLAPRTDPDAVKALAAARAGRATRLAVTP